MPEEPLGPEGPDNLDLPPSFFPYEGDEHTRESGQMGEPVEVTVEGVYEAETAGKVSRFVLVASGERKLPILIGPYEAQAIILPLEGTRPDRPMSHDLIHNIVGRLGAKLNRIVIDDLWNSVYYAKLYVQTSGGEIEIDARPSDAIALALRFGAPVFVAEGVFDASDEE